MADIVAVSNKSRTPMGYLDFARPLVMKQAESVLGNIVNVGKTADVVSFGSEVSAFLQESRFSHLVEDTYLEEIERNLNNRKSMGITTDDPKAQINIVFSLFYAAANQLDKTSKNTAELDALYTSYNEARTHMESKFLSNYTGQDKRTLQRIIDTTTGRFSQIFDRFNTLLEAGKVGGGPLTA
ncbi:MAG: hypothetical protein CMO81_08390 [Waddliaceae bacterium]|nr:hypothetical protein [Waddliaceae bacterium]